MTSRMWADKLDARRWQQIDAAALAGPLELLLALDPPLTPGSAPRSPQQG